MLDEKGRGEVATATDETGVGIHEIGETVETGATAWLVSVHEGRVIRVERGPFLMREWSFAVRASDEAWRRFWEPVPAAGWHDLFAMTKGGHATVEGDLRPLMANLRYVKDVLAKPRRRA